MQKERSLRQQILETIEQFIDSRENSLKDRESAPAFAQPLVAFARGDDPIFDLYKEHVGPFHWTPLEAFQLKYPQQTVEPKDLTIVSWVLPQTKRTKQDNRREQLFPSESWARARIFGESVNNSLRRRVVELLLGLGLPAVAPVLLTEWSKKDSRKFVWASTWSERHMAYAAGLGTFGLCDGLITPKGKAIRVGSVVVKTRDLPVSQRPYTDHHAYCLYYTAGTCLVCAKRCPVNAISEKGHDKIACRNHVHENCKEHVRTAYGLEGYACGLCQTGVPCESGIPKPGRESSNKAFPAKGEQEQG